VSKLESLSAFDGIATPGRYGKAEGEAGAIVSERKDLGLASVEMRKGQSEALKAAVQTDYGVDLPDGPTVAQGKGVSFIGTGPGQWFAVSETLNNEMLADELAAKLTGLASIADQNSSRAVLRLSGAHARDVLAKGFPIDLDPRVFPPGAAATGNISHMGVLVWRDGDNYDIALFRSLAGSFWGWLTSSAAEYGCEVVTTS